MTNEIDVLLNAIQKAGNAIAALSLNNLHITRKSNNDYLTDADLLANAILKEKLCGSFPEYGWLSEETTDSPHRLNCKRVWIVDPIDGTREFMKGIPEYALSVALVEEGKPILAAVFNPAKKQLFHAISNQGAWLNQKPIYCHYAPHPPLTILASRNEIAAGIWRPFEHKSQIQEMGSIAYKLALVAAGMAHATFSLTQKNEWDIAAGACLIQAAGGMITDKNQQVHLFNQIHTRIQSVVACTKETYPLIHKMIENAATETT